MSVRQWREEPKQQRHLRRGLGVHRSHKLSEGDLTIPEEQALPVRAKPEGKMRDHGLVKGIEAARHRGH